MLEREETVPLTEDVFRLIRDIIKDHCGLYFDDSSRYLIEKRLSRRIRGHHLREFRDYYRFIRYDKKAEEELAAIMDVLTVNETYFFREMNQLKAFGDEILDELHQRNRGTRRLRVWSAGCSTGEEPYTIAMLFHEKGLFSGWDVEIYGSDINQRVLQSARRGVYRTNSFRATEPYFLKKYFTVALSGALYKITIGNNGLSGVRVDVYQNGVYQEELSSKYSFKHKARLKNKKPFKQSKAQDATFYINASGTNYDVTFTPVGIGGNSINIMISR